MGAFDTYEGDAQCPRCGDVHHVSGQTKFFVPERSWTREETMRGVLGLFGV